MSWIFSTGSEAQADVLLNAGSHCCSKQISRSQAFFIWTWHVLKGSPSAWLCSSVTQTHGLIEEPQRREKQLLSCSLLVTHQVASQRSTDFFCPLLICQMFWWQWTRTVSHITSFIVWQKLQSKWIGTVKPWGTTQIAQQVYKWTVRAVTPSLNYAFNNVCEKKAETEGFCSPPVSLTDTLTGFMQGSSLCTSILQHILYIWSRRKPSTA